jgi:hypothetical protein
VGRDSGSEVDSVTESGEGDDGSAAGGLFFCDFDALFVLRRAAHGRSRMTPYGADAPPPFTITISEKVSRR